MEYLLSAFFIVIECLIIFNAGDAFFVKNKKSNCMIYSLIYMAVSFVLANFLFEGSIFIKATVSVFFIFILYASVYNGKIILKISAALSAYILLYSFDYLILVVLTAITDTSVNEILMTPVAYITAACTSKFSLYTVSFILKHLLKNNTIGVNFNKRYFILSIIFPVFSMITLVILFSISLLSDIVSYWIALDVIGIIIANIALLTLIDRIELSEKINRENIILEQRLKTEINNIETVTELYSEQRKLTHDYKNHLIAITDMAEKGRSNDIKTYTQKLLDEIPVSDMIIDTNNSAANSIINHKYHQAKQKNIAVSFEINNLKNLFLSDNDLVTVIANALDNAIEASSKTADRQIRLKIINDGDTITISVMNTSGYVAIKDNEIIHSTIDVSHGYGLKNIKNTLSKYNHIFAVDYSNGWFQLAIIINKI